MLVVQREATRERGPTVYCSRFLDTLLLMLLFSKLTFQLRRKITPLPVNLMGPYFVKTLYGS